MSSVHKEDLTHSNAEKMVKADIENNAPLVQQRHQVSRTKTNEDVIADDGINKNDIDSVSVWCNFVL